MVLPLLAAGVGLAAVTAVVPGMADKIGQVAGDAVSGVISVIIPASIDAVETGYETIKEKSQGREVQVISFVTASIIIIGSTLFILAKIRSVGAVRIN